MKIKRKNRLASLVVLLFSFLLLYISLYGNGMIGLSDNGDFLRIMEPNRISYPDGVKEPFAFNSLYHVEDKGDTAAERLFNLVFTLDKPYSSTNHVFIKLSLLLNRIHRYAAGQDVESYNIFWLGFVYLAFLIPALALLAFKLKTGRSWLDTLIYITFSLVFCDVAYVAYFNSFYGEAAQIVSVAWIAASAAAVVFSERKRLLYVFLYYVSVIIFMGSKFANIPPGILLSLAGLVFLVYSGGRKAFKNATILLLAASAAFGLAFYKGVPKWMEEQTTYQAVFFGVLKGSSNPSEDLEALGLPQEYSVLAGTTAYMTQYPIDIQSQAFRDNFYGRASKLDVLRFYITHPARLFEKLEISAMNSAHIRPVYLSNLMRPAERMTFWNRSSSWSGLRLKLPFDNIYFIGIVFLVSLLAIVSGTFKILKKRTSSRQAKVFTALFSVLCGINAISIVIPITANGEADLAKHMFSFIMGFDLQILILVFLFMHHISGAWKPYIKALSKKLPKSRIFFGMNAIVVIILFLANKPYQTPHTVGGQPGINSVVSFGTLNGKPIRWRVIDRTPKEALLFSEEPLFNGAFDEGKDRYDEERRQYGSNFWPVSVLRYRLNHEFIKCFSEEELKVIKEVMNKCLVSESDLEYASGGSGMLFWSHVPALADYGFDRAFYTTVSDRIFLPDVKQYRSLIAGKGSERLTEGPYWLETPYYGNASMVRVVGEDGYIYMKDANSEEPGVRPALVIKLEPFNLTIDKDNHSLSVTGG